MQTLLLTDIEDAASDNLKAKTTDIVCSLSQFNLIVVAGDDAAAFMQGQFTNDINKISEQHSQINAFCNKKGRMISNFRAFQYQGNYFLTVKSNLAERSIQHLQNYILRSHVAVQDVSDQMVILGISGDKATRLLSEFVDNINEEIDSVTANDDYILIRVAGEVPRYEVFCSLDKAKALWKALSSKAETVASGVWDYLNIQAGLSFIDQNTSEEFVPQMANMDLIDGISFTKGCYTGQEIVARMHYLGKVKKRCYKVNIDTDKKPENGAKLFAENARAGQNTGAIIQAEKNPDSGYDALAVIQVADADSVLYLNDENGPKVSLGELPYSFEITES